MAHDRRPSSFKSSTATPDILSLGMRWRCLFLALAILAEHWSLGSAAWARQWKPTPTESAQDYLQIEHGLSDQEGVIIFWFAPEYFEDADENRVIRKMTQEYMLVVIIHFSISDFGVWTFENPAEITVELVNTEPLTPLPQERLPPLVTTMTEFLKKIIASGIGKMGEGMKIFVFDGTRFDRCAEGALWVAYLHERYEYQTPIPGCE